MRTIDALIEAVRQEARRAEFPVDRPVYETVGKDPTEPVLFAGALDATFCVFGRDLGKDEVAVGEPLVGAGGRLVRAGVYRALTGGEPAKSDKRIESALAAVLLTNTVPYKPPGNKAYAEGVKARFRPFVAELLVDHWGGDRIVSLGTEAFEWFARYAEPGAADALWAREDRYEADLPLVLTVGEGDRARTKSVILGPLPHPSPLNQRWYGQFPGLLAKRLAGIRA